MSETHFRNERFRRCPTCGRSIALTRSDRLRRHFVIDETGRHQCYDRPHVQHAPRKTRRAA
jgi:hypothetical protein